MPLYVGRTYREGNVSLRPPNPAIIRGTLPATDVADAVEQWLSAASTCDDICYFSVYNGDDLVGQILLHDMDKQSGESLVAYHLFQSCYRGRGIGTQALALLQQFVIEWTALTKLTIITLAQNVASQRVAEKCGFIHVGKSREDARALVFQWNVPADRVTPQRNGIVSAKSGRRTSASTPRRTERSDAKPGD